jgi:hypothetical protein
MSRFRTFTSSPSPRTALVQGVVDAAERPPLVVTWHDTPTTYIACADDKALPVALARRFAARSDSTETWPTSHSPCLSNPTRVADLIHQRRL